MKDVLPTVAEMLSGIADVELAFPDTFADLPLITLTETGNTAEVIICGKDRYSIITLQIDVYADCAEDVRDIAVQISSVLTQKGMKRGFAQLFTDEDVPRMCMRFRFGLDEVTGRVVAL